MLFPTLGPSSLPVVVAQLTKDMQAEQLLCWSGMTDTERSTTSGSNEPAKNRNRQNFLLIQGYLSKVKLDNHLFCFNFYVELKFTLLKVNNCKIVEIYMQSWPCYSGLVLPHLPVLK